MHSNKVINVNYFNEISQLNRQDEESKHIFIIKNL